MVRSYVYALIDAERDYQDQKWGGPAHDKTHTAWDFALYIAKFLGKLVAALMDRDLTEARRQFVKVIALGVAALENVKELQPPVGDWRKRLPVGQRGFFREAPGHEGYAVISRHGLSQPSEVWLASGSGVVITGPFEPRWEPMTFVPGDVVEHPEDGVGIVYEHAYGDGTRLEVFLTKGRGARGCTLECAISEGLKLITPAAWSVR